jgi:chromate transporter
VINAELFVRFVIISLLAFGGGQAALPLVERLVVSETRWLSPSTFGTAVAFGYLTPGPVLITATFVGHRVAGLPGAVAATLGAFLMPWLLAAVTAQQATRWAQHPALGRFGAGATPAVIGLLGVTALTLTREAMIGAPYLLIAAVALVLVATTRIHPAALLAGGGIAGWLSH